MSSKNMHLEKLFVKAEKSELDELRAEYGKLRQKLDEKDQEIAQLKNKPAEDWHAREIKRAMTEVAAAYREQASEIRFQTFKMRNRQAV